jgi:hypothetical protein
VTERGSTLDFELTIAPLAGDVIEAASSALKPPPNPTQTPLVVNGSMRNAASSVDALPPAFGNHRPSRRGMYNGGVGLIFGTSALDARPFSLTGANLNAPSYGNLTGTVSFGGPLIIPHLLGINHAPMVTVNFERGGNRTLTTVGALVPTAAEREGNLSGAKTPITNPATGTPLPGNQVPVSAAAQALLALYPLPNQPAGGAGYNYQAALAGRQTQTSLQLRVNDRIGRNEFSGQFNDQDTHAVNTSLFGFRDARATLGLNTELAWRRQFTTYFSSTWTVNFSRQRIALRPNFAGQTNISGAAGIQGNDQTPANWGPPALRFASGIAALSDAEAQRNRNQTLGLSWGATWIRGDHNLSFGADAHWLEFNDLQQADGRGTFQFTGAATGNDWADFLLGIPDGATLANGNADKYLRERTYDAFVSDDWRLDDGLTADLGVRWESEAPATERYGRLANITVSPDFSSASTVTAITHSGSLLRASRGAIEPRLGIAWRPFAAASLLVRAGYGLYQNTSVYPDLALRLAEQAPFATSLNLQNGAATPLTMATAFLTPAGTTPDVFGVAPHFRPGVAQSWSASLQQDLPHAMVLTLSYLGTRGSHAEQEILPNTVPPGGSNPCPACPAGFAYLSATGHSLANSGTLQLQRRFSGGLAALGKLTWARAMDDAGLGGRGQSAPVIAQDWRHPDAEWGRSSFDQRVAASLTVQYSTGANRLGGALLRGWQATAVRGWTISAELTSGSGLPLTPMTPLLVPGTADAVVRPSLTGVAVTTPAPGRYLNPAAYALPAPGTWGDAGRNSITGPGQFNLDASLQRSFQMTSGLTALLRVDATNVLNHVTFPSWNTLAGSAQFGLPETANPMRSLKTTLRFSF